MSFHACRCLGREVCYVRLKFLRYLLDLREVFRRINGDGAGGRVDYPDKSSILVSVDIKGEHPTICRPRVVDPASPRLVKETALVTRLHLAQSSRSLATEVV